MATQKVNFFVKFYAPTYKNKKMQEKQKQETNVREMSDEEMEDILERLLSVRQERKKRRERDFEM